MKSILYISIILASYIISAYATTDISRLVSDTKQKYFTLDCYCPNCSHKLSAIDQIPVFSFYINHGKCKYCKTQIPLLDHMLEVGLFLFFTFSNILFKFSLTAFTIQVLCYEVIKIFIVPFYKKQLPAISHIFTSLVLNILIFGIYSFMFILLKLI